MFSATSKTATPTTITLSTSYTYFTFDRNVIFQYWPVSIPGFYVYFDNIEYYYPSLAIIKQRNQSEMVSIAANTQFGIRVTFSTIQIEYMIIEV
jgi:hypothetical protein